MESEHTKEEPDELPPVDPKQFSGMRGTLKRISETWKKF